MDIKNNEVLRRFRLANPKFMHLAIEAAFLRGFAVGIRKERHERAELERFLGKIGLSYGDFLKYGGNR